MPAYPDDRSAEISASLGVLPSGTPVSEVARRLMDLFTSGSIEAGTRLPPERHLAASLGVGRSAVREALAALEILGIVDVRPGSGTYLRGTASELLPQTLRWGLLIGERNTTELLELRSGLEIYVARLAAARATASDLEIIAGRVEAMRETVDDLGAFAKADLEFHHSLAEAAGNECSSTSCTSCGRCCRSMPIVPSMTTSRHAWRSPSTTPCMRRSSPVTRMRPRPPWRCTWRPRRPACRAMRRRRRPPEARQSGKTTPFVRMKQPHGCGSSVWTTAYEARDRS